MSPPTRSVLATTLAGYHIRASLDRPASIESRDDHALIALAHHRRRVEEGRVVLDDNETAAFPIPFPVSQTGTMRCENASRGFYRPRQPKQTAFYQLVEKFYPQFKAAYEEHHPFMRW